MNFEEWLRVGIASGHCGPPVCSTHDSVPTSEDEDVDFYNDLDPCVTVLRLYEDSDVKAAVEENHPPSQWRMSNLLWRSR